MDRAGGDTAGAEGDGTAEHVVGVGVAAVGRVGMHAELAMAVVAVARARLRRRDVGDARRDRARSLAELPSARRRALGGVPAGARGRDNDQPAAARRRRAPLGALATWVWWSDAGQCAGACPLGARRGMNGVRRRTTSERLGPRSSSSW